ncbi:mucin-2-like [Tigriopus californicus]|uniref:mucin-2-like n=1 Tax=Tigriopus californicus TaxID=6832 RepID=UPI0027DA348B|nr:mucin-2-like [Tigriopus californicus]
MGVSDIANADSLLDVIISLGATDSKIILSGSAFGNSFKLLDAEKNMPGSSVAEIPIALTYQQVCKTLKKGNWTVEREEDRTGPYAYDSKHWIAFDDANSLKIKTKYALLRNLAGVALFTIDADDVDNICGKGEFSLVKSIFKTMSELDRRPRQLIVHSLEEDLYADAQNFVPVSTSGVNVSPFRIVRVVDREGQITSIRQNSETILECTRQGYYRHPEDCSRFYRCVKFNQYENDYTIFEYGCPNGLVFDDRWEVCVWPSQATPCDGSSEIFPVPTREYSCPAEGYFVDPENCRWFFACLDHKGDGTFTHYEFRCPFSLAFDEELLICNWPWLVPACGGTRSGNQRVVPNRLPSRQQKSFGRAGGRGKQPGGIGSRGPVRQSFGGSSGAYESSSPARQPVSNNRYRQRQKPTTDGYNPSPASYQTPSTPYTTARPVYSSSSRRPIYQSTTQGQVYPAPTQGSAYGSSGSVYGEIASDSCDNCESPELIIRGNGHVSGGIIETAYGSRNQGQKERRPKDYSNPSSEANYNYNPSTTPSYNYNSPSSSASSNYNPSPSAGYENNNPSTVGYDDYNGPSSTPGYGSPSSTAAYGSPSSPANYGSPSSTASYGSPSSTAAYGSPSSPANYGSPSSTASYGSPSSTAAYGSPSSPASYGSPLSTTDFGYTPSTTASPNYPPSSSAGYSYPTPENPLELPERRPNAGIAVSNPGEVGLRPGSFGPSTTSYETPEPTSPNTTPYSPSSYAPTTPSPTYRPTTPSYPSTTSAFQQPAYQSSQRPYQPTQRPSYVSTTQSPSYPSSTKQTNYPSTTRAPQYQSSTARPQYPSTTRRPYEPEPNYESYREPEAEYERPSYQPEPNYRPRPNLEQTGDDNGYTYPVPENPLELPEKRPSYPSTTNRPYFPTTPRPVNPSTTARPVYPQSGYQPESARPTYPQQEYQPEPSRPVYPQQQYDPESAQPNYPQPEYRPNSPRPEYPQPDYEASRNPQYQPTTRQPSYPSTTRQPQYQPTGRPSYPSTTQQTQYQPTAGQPSYPSTTRKPEYQPTTRQPAYPSTTQRPKYQPTTRQPLYQSPSTTAQPSYPSSTPGYQTSDDSGYTYPVPSNPLELPQRKPKNGPGFGNTDNGSFRPPQVQYGGFKPPYVPDLPSQRPNYQEPKYQHDVVPEKIEYGFRPSYNKDIPSVRQPYYEDGGIAPPQQEDRRPKYQDDSQYRPDFSDQDKSYLSSVTTAVYDYVTTTIAPYVSGFGSSSFSQSNSRPGNYNNIPQVASVIPSGFTSATLSNGPHSIPDDFEQRRPPPNQGSSFHTVFGGSQSSNKGPINPNRNDLTNKRPTPQPTRDEYRGPPPSTGNNQWGSLGNDNDNRRQKPNRPDYKEPTDRYNNDQRQANGGYQQRPSSTGYSTDGNKARPDLVEGNGGYNGRPGPNRGNGNDGNIGRPGPNGNRGNNGRPSATKGNTNVGYNGRPGPNGSNGNGGYNGQPGPSGDNGNSGYYGRPGPNRNNGRPGPASSNGNNGNNGRPGPVGGNGNNGNIGRPGPVGGNGNGGYNGRPGPAGGSGNGGSNGRPGPNGINVNNGNLGRPGPVGGSGNGGYNGRPGPNRSNGKNVNNGRPSPVGGTGNGGYGGRPGPNGNRGSNGRPSSIGGIGNGGYNGRPGPNGNGGSSGRPGQNGNGGYNGRPGPAGGRGNGGYNGRPGPNGSNGNGGYNGRPGPNGSNGNGGYNGRPGPNGSNGNGGYNGRPGSNGSGGFNGKPGPNGQRGGRQGSGFPQNGVTAISRPVQKQPAVLSKFTGTSWDKFGPGGYRGFNDTIGPEVCERPGLFRHPSDCDKFYECYWDKWVERYTVHVFPCPVVLGFDSGITACNWPFEGPQGCSAK